MAKKSEEVYLIDGSSYIFRAYHAMGGLSTSKGVPTGAIFGFTNMLLRTLRERQPGKIAVVFDAKGPTFRHERYPEYKANRPPAPEDLVQQIPRIHEIVDAFGLPRLMVPGFEADDVIATLTRSAREQGLHVMIVGSDKDLMQLVEEGVLMWDPQKDQVYDGDAVTKKWGVPPEKLGDLLALMGDSSDNVPGVRGIGPKTAAALIEKYGSVQGVYSNLDNVTQKKAQTSLSEHKQEALLSRELVTLDAHVPLEVGIDDLSTAHQDDAKLRELFKELEFKRFLADLPATQTIDYTGYETVATHEALDRVLAHLTQVGSFAVDTETTSQQPVRAELVGISLAAEEGKAFYIPVGHEVGTQLPKAEVLRKIAPLLEDPNMLKAGQNIKYDMIVLKKEGIAIRGVVCDTMLASYLLDPGRRGHSLDDLAEIFLEHRTIPIKDLIGTGKKQVSFAEVDIPAATTYAGEDADVTLRLASILGPRIEQEGLSELFQGLELPLIPVLVDMELAGVRVDIPYLMDLSREFGIMVEKSENEIYQLAGEEFNINSPKQLSEVLFVKLGLKPTKKTKTGPSTSLDVLETLALEHDLPRKILEYRSIFKLKSTYVDALTGLVNPRTHRIHTSYNQAVAATGRLSSSDPNLQNIPVRSPEGRKIRKAFVPEKGHVFVAADYSQIELRVMAHLSGDKRLRDAFAGGEDVHAITAASIFGCSPAHVTPEMRRKAKEINFGIIYGMGPFNLASRIGVGLKMAKKYLEDYYFMYAGVKEYMDKVPEQAAKDGYVSTVLGRKRFLPDLKNPNKIAQQAARRMAVNTTIQGSAADIIKLAMIHVHKVLGDSGLAARMILQVHDELILEVREDCADEAAKLLKREMEGAYPLSVPLVVDTATGTNWDEAH
ncbi:MAG: DNA polymerase I [Thermodesulfobacteriota bacterium]